MSKRMRAEWERHRAILLAFPHQWSDWNECLEEARANFVRIIAEILRFEEVILCIDPRDVCGEEMICQRFAQEIASQDLQIAKVPLNDTWTRDFGAINLWENDQNVLLDFGFNGWGLKFASCFDNQVNARLKNLGVFDGELRRVGMVLEGGSIESDGNGSILTNTQCLLEANRNPHLSQDQIEYKLQEIFGAERILWLNHGYLAGDDTDSHIDTLARFLSPSKIAYVGCDDENDEHYEELLQMELELQNLRDSTGNPYELIKLPFVRAIYDSDGNRLPATYANFLFVNGALLVPTYQDTNDNLALDILQKALPDREVIGIDCQTLIKQHGSLHCVSMQIY
ncbi:agmatine deiminase [Helicobacter enhydrae]|uniref:Agmatine deiminase n=1 Tax=Helicobacter enhydrae TaxID=222136 RepID=A0A1B1U3X9_9HELI|nr:agmatine deiminase family protein [Helicobacter enhydrae]ANV97459.1 agmatine deiminase [Helicobacter enhydrae]